MNETSSPDSQVSEIQRLMRENQLESAGNLCEQLVEQAPDYAPGWATFSELWLRCGEYQKAGGAAGKALELDDRSVDFNILFGRCLLHVGEYLGANQFARKALELGPTRADQFDHLGNIFSRAGDHRMALNLFTEAARRAPRHPGILHNLATSLRVFGMSEQAEQVFDEALRLNPGDFGALYQRSMTRTQTADRNHLDALKQAVEHASAPYTRALARYALAKELEDLEQFQAAFEHLSAGAGEVDRLINEQPDAEIAGMQALADLDPRSFGPAEDAPTDGPTPVFIVGLPRSGTSLVENILGAHDDLAPCGELKDLQMLLTRQVGGDPNEPLVARVAGSVEQLDLGALGRAWLERVAPRAGEHSHFTDKMPQNALYLGLIHAALPNARIILVERDPVDNCYALYKHLFAGKACGYSYDLDKLARYYLAHRKLTDFWQSVIPDSSLMVCRYETLVQSPREVVEKMLAFANLSWQESCLAFHQQTRPTATGSASQVNQPIHARSVGLWKRYRENLAPLVERLRQGGMEIQ